jgi:hypothetical protein
LASSPGRLDNHVAPRKAKMPPGNAMMPTTRQSTLPKRQCAAPETSVVPTSDRCTAAEAAAGAMPAARSREEEVTP